MNGAEQVHIVYTVACEFLQIDGSDLKQVVPTVLTFAEGKVNQAAARSRLKTRLVEIGREIGDRRLNLCLETAFGLSCGYRRWAQNRSADVIDLYPAMRFADWEHRLEPVDWNQKWRESGGQFFGAGDMLALVNDPVWCRLSVLGLPFAPFDIGSGMEIEVVSRDEAESLGLTCPCGPMEPLGFDLNFGPALRQRLAEYFSS